MKVRIPQGPSQGDMIKQVKKMQDDMAAKQEELDERVYDVSAGGGIVNIKIKGTSEILSIKIDPSVINAEDVEILEDMLVAGVNEAFAKVDDIKEKEMEKLTSGVNMPKIPGLY